MNLSQSELAEKAGLSIRTVQRIESGATPKGYTLDALCKALEISREQLRDNNDQQNVNWRMVKYLNLLCLPLMIIPAANILIPIALIYWKKEINQATKQIVSIQILWTIISLMVIILVAIIREWLDLAPQIMALTVMLLVASNFYIIIKNAKDIERNQSLSIKPSFSLF